MKINLNVFYDSKFIQRLMFLLTFGDFITVISEQKEIMIMLITDITIRRFIIPTLKKKIIIITITKT